MHSLLEALNRPRIVWIAPAALAVAVVAMGPQGETAQAASADSAGLELFETRIRPLLVDNCVRCHGPKRQRADLRLDSPEWIRAGGERGAVIVPGDAEASRLIQAVRYYDQELQMPPKSRLPDELIAELEGWVEAGAPMPAGAAAVGTEEGPAGWEERRAHWSFQPVVRRDPPGSAEVAPIDAFLRAALLEAGLEPAPRADRATILRRLSFDLIGLPPSPAELDAFLNDEAPGAYERQVDRLLASPHFGERWTRHWLDLVRYAETRGHEFDHAIPNAWQYRDYLVRAFNADVPYARLLSEHVAGDLLEEARLNPREGFDESPLGTGFWFLGEAVHSPVDVRADQTERVANQVDVFSKAFLGLTAACARCHDHKFDPITTEEFYALSGFPMSASYRQIRFDTDERNGRIARAVDELERTQGARIADRMFELLAAELAHLDEELMLGAEVALLGPLKTEAVFEDFEGGTYGGWTPTGEAFGVRPMRVEELAAYQGNVRALGKGLVNSHDTRGGRGVRDADALTGTLTSPTFTFQRDYVHFLLGGGSDEELCAFQLLVDGEVVRSASGRDDHRMRSMRFDVSELRGREARFRVVDAHTGAWGNIGIDQLVFSDTPDAGALDAAPVSAGSEGFVARAAELCGGTEFDPVRVGGLAEAVLIALEDPAHPLHAFALRALPGLAEETAELSLEIDDPASIALPADAVVHADYRRADAPWYADGWRFGLHPRPIATPRFGDDPERPLVALQEFGAASTDPAFAGLTLAEGVQGEPSRYGKLQAGRTLRTATFELSSGPLHFLVRGAGAVYTPVSGHRLNEGPLHKAFGKEWPDSGGWQWISCDLSEYVGLRAHTEFTPADGELEVALVIESATTPDPVPTRSDPLRAAHGDAGARAIARAPRAIARALHERFTSAAVSLTRAGEGDSLPEPHAVRIVSWLLSSAGLPFSAAGRAAARELSGAFVARRRALLDELRFESRTAPAMLEGSGVDENVLLRGSYRSPGAPARRRLIEAVTGDAEPWTLTGSGRRELARKLIDPLNPLVARVFVNRLWHHLFGRGLVSSVDDFGHMGELPTHPELLDWLASELVEGGWSMKAAIRRIVMSEAYRQASVGDPRALEIDPTNRLLARAPVRRLQAEAIRDSMLAVSGQLDRELFGPPVAVHLTSFMKGRGRPVKSGPLNGARRRSLYIEVRRNFLPPSFLVFDFPLPASTIGKRTVSNVPAQALTLMNDPFVLEQAAHWARRELAAPGVDDGERLARMFRHAFARELTDEERALTLAFLREQQASYEALELEGDSDEAGSRELAWADLAHVLFNDKEFLYLR